MKPLDEKALEVALTTWFGEAGWRNGCSNAVIESAENAMRDAIRAYMAALDPAPGWMPIETAPRDGSRMLWCFDNGEYAKVRWTHCVIRWPEYDDCFADGFWMPLPSPPAAPMSQEG